ncbi:hypothetical protein [Enterococcus sp. LJL90]
MNQIKPKSFVYRFSWVAILLAALSLIFIGVAVIMQVVPIDSDHFNLSVNGVRQTYNSENLRTFRLIFLAAFGGIGGVLLLVAVILFARSARKNRRIENLRATGKKVLAEVVDYNFSGVTVNNRRATYLICSYQAKSGEHLNFKSPLLRRDPTPYLPNGEVIVYYDKTNLKNYFVDIDGSMEKVVEL